MAKEMVILKQSGGLNNIVDSVEFPFSPENGVPFLGAAYNVDIDHMRRIKRRSGFTATNRTESVHSLFAEGQDSLFISDQHLYRLYKDFSRKGLRSGLTLNARMSYAKVESKIYYTNGFENGYVQGDTSYVWARSTYKGPETVKQFVSAPVGKLLELYAGRMYIAQGKVLWYSRPFSYNLYDPARDYIIFEGDLKMVASVSDGMYIGTDKDIIFLSGREPKEFEFITVADYPPVEGTAVKMNSSIIEGLNSLGRAVIFATTKGICIGGSSGNFVNLTRDSLDYPAASYGSGIVKNDKYICLLEP